MEGPCNRVVFLSVRIIPHERRREGNNMGLGVVNIDTKDILANAGSIFSGFGDLLKDIRTAITGKAPLDPTKLAELESKSLEIEQTLMTAQTAINAIEASNPSRWVSGWRPAVGWICALGLFTNYFIFPIASWLLPIVGHPEIKLPALDVADLYPLLFGLLGLGTLRTYEKSKGVARQN
jgi:hypothetical protein